MTVHLRRLAVGVENIDHLAAIQGERLAGAADRRLFTYTRMVPKRAAELLDGGSLYWIVKGRYAVRQRILAIEDDTDGDGRRFCRLGIDPVLVPVEPRAHKAFQGWRYLAPKDAPPDLGRAAAGDGALPPEMAAELRDLGLL